MSGWLRSMKQSGMLALTVVGCGALDTDQQQGDQQEAAGEKPTLIFADASLDKSKRR